MALKASTSQLEIQFLKVGMFYFHKINTVKAVNTQLAVFITH